MPYHFQEISSTQIFLKQLVQSEPHLSHLEYAIADLQTAGIGRHGRSWLSEPGNLALSIYIRDFSIPLTWIPHWVGLALIESLDSLHVPTTHLKLKWPNDLIVNETRKAGGILCEKIGDGIIAGIGVNLISAPELSDRETANIRALAPSVDFFQFHLKLCEAILENLRREPTLPELQKKYQARSLLTEGRKIQWMDLQTQVTGEGIFLRYGEFGELVVTDAGKERLLYSEEVKLKL